MTDKANILIDARALQTGFKAHKHRGIGHYAKQFIDELLNRYHNEYQYTFLQEKGFPVDDILKHQELIFHIPVRINAKPVQIISSQWTLSHTVKQNKFSLIHFLSHTDASFRLNSPFIVSVMDTITLSQSNLYTRTQQIKQQMMHAIGQRIVQRAIRIIAISEHTKKDIVKYYNVPSEKIDVVYLAADKYFFDPYSKNEKDAILAKYGINKPYVFYVGGIDPRKNVNIIFKSLRLLLEKQQYCPILAFAGNISNQREYPAMLNLIRTLGIENRIKFLGYVEDKDLPLLYSASIAFIYPSLYEGFGLPVLQAMAAGTPVITTKLSSIPEVAGNAALYIDPNDPLSLAQTMEGIISNNTLRLSLIDAGRKQASLFSWKRTANETLNVYNEVIKRHKKRS
jgi:glycosyltransferase involved in cell wall biosynthesis